MNVNENRKPRWLVRVIIGFACVTYVLVIATLMGGLAEPWVGVPMILVAVLVSYVLYSDLVTGKWTNRYETWQPRYASRVAIVVTVVGLVLTTSVVGAGASTDGIGGPSGGFKFGDNHRVGIGSNWADVWHTGYYPLGGFRNYDLHLKIYWSFSHKGLYRIDARPHVEVFTDRERFIKFDPRTDIIAQKGYFSDCVIEGHVRKRGCYYAFIKVKIMITTPGKVDLMPTYPWLSIKVNGRGEVVVPSWSRGKV